MEITTINEAITYTQQALGEWGADYDVEAIARDLTAWDDGQLILEGDTARFWEVAAEHEV